MDLIDVPEDVFAKLPKPLSKLDLRYNRLYIVEWLHASEIKTGAALRDFLLVQRPKLDVRFHSVQSKAEVLAALAAIAVEVERDHAFPILQIEAHGDEDAIGFHGPGSNKPQETLPFHEIGDALVRINRACKANLILFSAACWGLGALQAAAEGPIPFMVVVGPTDKVYSTPLLDASKEFYRKTFPKAGEPESLGTIVDSASLEIGKPGDLGKSYMVQLTYEALARAMWSKSAPKVMQETAQRMACQTGHSVSTVMKTLNEKQGAMVRKVWAERLLLDSWPENWPRFDFDIEGMVKIILDEQNASTPSPPTANSN